ADREDSRDGRGRGVPPRGARTGPGGRFGARYPGAADRMTEPVSHSRIGIRPQGRGAEVPRQSDQRRTLHELSLVELQRGTRPDPAPARYRGLHLDDEYRAVAEAPGEDARFPDQRLRLL